MEVVFRPAPLIGFLISALLGVALAIVGAIFKISALMVIGSILCIPLLAVVCIVLSWLQGPA
jgi:hypothetical protein